MSSGSNSASETEVEWQFDALDLGAVERWLVAAVDRSEPLLDGVGFVPPRRGVRLTDTYLDTADWHLARAGYVLRIRRQARRGEVTMKNLVKADDGLRRRLEVTETLPAEGLSALADGGAVGWRLRALTGRSALHPIVEVTTRRRTFVLTRYAEPVAELVLDSTSLGQLSTTKKMHLRRVELEVGPEAVNAFGPFIEAMRIECGLQPAALSKFEAGLLGAGLRIPGPPNLGTTVLGNTPTLAELAYGALRDDTQALLAHEPGTRLGQDIEELHQMRVATRRLRAALAMFGDVLPLRAAAIRVEVGWLATILGGVRDLDVQLERTGEWMTTASETERDHLGELSARLERERTGARLTMLEALDSRRYGRLVAALTAMLAQGTIRRSPAARTPAGIAMPEIIGNYQAAAVRAAQRAKRTHVASDFHRLRIRCKRLRYALDFAESLYGPDRRRYARTLAKLQGELGAMQDAEVAADRLRDLALEGLDDQGSGLSVGAVFTVGGIAERYRMEMQRLLVELAVHVDVLRGQQWSRLKATMDRRRDELAATIQAATRPESLAPVAELRLRTASTELGEVPNRVPAPPAVVGELGSGLHPVSGSDASSTPAIS